MTPSDPPAPNAGFGAQSHGSRKGLGGDPPNAPVKRQTPRQPDEATRAQIADMQSEGQGQAAAPEATPAPPLPDQPDGPDRPDH